MFSPQYLVVFLQRDGLIIHFNCSSEEFWVRCAVSADGPSKQTKYFCFLYLLQSLDWKQQKCPCLLFSLFVRPDAKCFKLCQSFTPVSLKNPETIGDLLVLLYWTQLQVNMLVNEFYSSEI